MSKSVDCKIVRHRPTENLKVLTHLKRKEFKNAKLKAMGGNDEVAGNGPT